ncbi:hypothetical protein LTR37_014489 [Vermiconidia calcicola]|uniref:Uncharacterized protein n=1 Tax=Vermiconidia calcicola TaxID=1690605 RepID=A0ACC3MUY3_9PEZI|nr:hypothetical protein LTR37_014489 [Vermiconidia calcicola]
MNTYMNPTARAAPNEIPRFVTYTSPVSTLSTNDGSRATTLPLNLVALIVSHLDDLADIARITRTCRLLYYMSLPQLYRKVSLRSYPEIRYVNGRPEGFGSGSPFTMALNGLITKDTHANLVQEFRVYGQWSEVGAEDFAKGRVPDNTMMLNILMRAASDKMTKLRSFSWELDCKPLKTVYQGLSAHSTLTSLTIKFPSTRTPRPSVIIPPMAILRAFRATDIDPLCYPDDISVLLLNSKKLEDLRLHFSPRMRQEAESGLNLDNYFGRCLRAQYKLPLKHFAIQNFYGPPMAGMSDVLDNEVCTSVAFLDLFGGGNKANSATVFLEQSWNDVPQTQQTHFRQVRINEPAPNHVTMLSQSEGLERLYVVNEKRPRSGLTPKSPGQYVTPGGTPTDPDDTVLAKQYIYALTRYHGRSLKHLLFPEQWNLAQEDLSDLIRYCPNLEQLAIAVNTEHAVTAMHLLLPFLPKLKAMRVLGSECAKVAANDSTGLQQMEEMKMHLEKLMPSQMMWIGVGQHVWKAGRRYETMTDDGILVTRRKIMEASLDDVKHVQIWGLDTLDIMSDPAPKFSP